MEWVVAHREAVHRFEVEEAGYIAYVEYVLFNGGINFTHTWVPKALEGRGIASVLVAYVLQYARDNGLKVVTGCSFIGSYIKRNPEYQDLL